MPGTKAQQNLIATLCANLGQRDPMWPIGSVEELVNDQVVALAERCVRSHVTFDGRGGVEAIKMFRQGFFDLYKVMPGLKNTFDLIQAFKPQAALTNKVHVGLTETELSLVIGGLHNLKPLANDAERLELIGILETLEKAKGWA